MGGSVGWRVATVALAALATQACATRGYVREQVREARALTSADVSAARDSAIRAANASREEADSQVVRQMDARMETRMQALRADIEALRRDFDARVTQMEEALTFAMPIGFGFDEASVRSGDHPLLERFAAIVRMHYPQSKVTIEGFADPAGSREYNLRLSERRAEAVRTALVNYGLNAENLKTVGYGETRLVTPGAWGDEPGADLNRRVVFAIETRGSAVSTVTSTDGTAGTQDR